MSLKQRVLYSAIVVALVMVLMILPVAAAATMVSIGNQYYQGGDYLGYQTAINKDTCKNRCLQDARCKKLTWTDPYTEKNPYPDGACWLKDDSPLGPFSYGPRDSGESWVKQETVVFACLSGTPCNNNCVDLQTDPMNCGSCGHSCGQLKCEGGSCFCPSNDITANIIADQTTGPAPLTVTFHDQSTGVTKVHWDFGDNNAVDSLGMSSQLHTYSREGTYTARIWVYSACGNSQNILITITVQPSQPTTGSLSVNSNPSGASVYVDTVYQGTTPVTIPQLAAGSHTVRLTLTGYTDYDQTVNVYATQTPLINHQFTQSQSSSTTGSLAVTSTPSGATIILDGKNKGQTPATLSDLSTGDHTAKLTKSGYWDFSQTVHIDAGQTTPLDVTLVSSTQPAPSLTSATPTPYQPVTGGAIVITSNPPGANVYLDGKSSGTTPVTLQNVNPGSRTVLLTMQGYSDASRTVEVTAGSQNQISVDLIGGKKTPGFEAALAVFSITGLVLFRMLYRKEE